MSSTELHSWFLTCPRVVLPDLDYARPTLAWLQGPFWESFQADRWAKGLKTWERRNDCDNFARAYAQHAQDCHAITHAARETNGLEEGLAVGEIFYTQDKTRSGHAINCAFTDAGRVFIEPQTGLTTTLTDRELASIFFVRF